jgi:hypothetical protein
MYHMDKGCQAGHISSSVAVNDEFQDLEGRRKSSMSFEKRLKSLLRRKIRRWKEISEAKMGQLAILQETM